MLGLGIGKKVRTTILPGIRKWKLDSSVVPVTTVQAGWVWVILYWHILCFVALWNASNLNLNVSDSAYSISQTKVYKPIVKVTFFAPPVAHIHCEHVFGIVGENFTFPVQPDKKIVEIIWTKNKDIVAEWEGQNKPTYFTSLRNRGLLNKENGCLTIFNLEDNDTGTYVLDYLDSEEKSYALTFVLAVLRK